MKPVDFYHLVNKNIIKITTKSLWLVVFFFFFGFNSNAVSAECSSIEECLVNGFQLIESSSRTSKGEAKGKPFLVKGINLAVDACLNEEQVDLKFSEKIEDLAEGIKGSRLKDPFVKKMYSEFKYSFNVRGKNLCHVLLDHTYSFSYVNQGSNVDERIDEYEEVYQSRPQILNNVIAQYPDECRAGNQRKTLYTQIFENSRWGRHVRKCELFNNLVYGEFVLHIDKLLTSLVIPHNLDLNDIFVSYITTKLSYSIGVSNSAKTVLHEYFNSDFNKYDFDNYGFLNYIDLAPNDGFPFEKPLYPYYRLMAQELCADKKISKLLEDEAQERLRSGYYDGSIPKSATVNQFKQFCNAYSTNESLPDYENLKSTFTQNIPTFGQYVAYLFRQSQQGSTFNANQLIRFIENHPTLKEIGVLPLHLAVELEDPQLVKAILETGVNIEKRDFADKSALTYALEKDDELLQQLLIESNANVLLAGWEMWKEKKWTSIQMADFVIEHGTRAGLAQHYKDDKLNSILKDFIYLFAEVGYLPVVKHLIEMGGETGIAATIAINNGHYDVAEYIQEFSSTKLNSVPSGSTQTSALPPVPTHNVDKQSPVIKILNPISERGLSRVSVKPINHSVMVSGVVYDQSPISSLTVNGKVVEMQGNGFFEVPLSLTQGRHEIAVEATDSSGNQARVSLSLDVESESRGLIEKLKWYRNQHAIVVGIDHYKNTNIPALNNAVNDAKVIAEVFNSMGYSVTTLVNEQATRRNILKAIQKVRNESEQQDSFVFYFAGHGQAISLEHAERKGYLLPYDTTVSLESNDIFEYDESAIALNSIRQYSKVMKAKHVALLLDSCFSGLAMKRNIPVFPAADLAYYNDMLSRKAINILTAGDDQPVSDGTGHSPFTRAIIEGLKNSGLDVNDRDGLASFNELAVYVKNKVEKATNRRQRPQFDNLSGEDGGMLFQLK